MKNSIWTAKYIEGYFQTNLTNEWASQYPRWRQYDLGAMLVETLAAVKGPASTMELWKTMGTGLNFTKAFEKVYGISFEKALPIISKAIALALGRS